MTETVTRKRPYLPIAAVLVVVAGVVAWLVLGHGTEAASVQKSTSGPYTVQLPGFEPHVGNNTLTVQVSGAAPAAVSFEPVMPQMGHALAPVPAAPAGSGTYRADGVALPMAGQWEITVSLRGPAGGAQVVFPLLVKG